MVLRLFIPPGEGQHHIVPRRPDPLGADATLQYAVIASTALAAGYASYAAPYTRRIAPNTRVSRIALFIKASGRLGVWAIALGAATNAWYHRSFTSLVLSHTVTDPTPPKLYEKTAQYTVDDGLLTGAATGFLAFLPTLLIRRPTVPAWTRAVGMANIGACSGVLASHAYFHHTGARQKALEELDRQRRRRMLEFHHVFWDKMLMQRFDPLVQAYIRHNGIFRAYHIPAEVLEEPDKYGILSAPAAEAATAMDSTAPENAAYYIVAPDWREHLKAVRVEELKVEIAGYKSEKAALLKEAEWMAWQLSVKQYDFVHEEHGSEEEKQVKIRELQLLTIVFNRLRAAADEVDRRIWTGQHWLRQRAAFDASAERSKWMADHPSVETPETHDPTISIAELKKFEEQFKNEVNIFDSRVKSPAKEDVDKRDKWRKDLDEARTMLRATDRITSELEKRVPQKIEEAAVETRKVETPAKAGELVKVEGLQQEDAPKVEDSPKVEQSQDGLSQDKS